MSWFDKLIQMDTFLEEMEISQDLVTLYWPEDPLGRWPVLSLQVFYPERNYLKSELKEYVKSTRVQRESSIIIDNNCNFNSLAILGLEKCLKFMCSHQQVTASTIDNLTTSITQKFYTQLQRLGPTKKLHFLEQIGSLSNIFYNRPFTSRLDRVISKQFYM